MDELPALSLKSVVQQQCNTSFFRSQQFGNKASFSVGLVSQVLAAINKKVVEQLLNRAYCETDGIVQKVTKKDGQTNRRRKYN